MNRKIIGVTVGTPLSANWVKEKINPVRKVNGVSPDENGNVQTELSEEEVQTVVDHALREAKESGEFDGANGVGIVAIELVDENGESTSPSADIIGASIEEI